MQRFSFLRLAAWVVALVVGAIYGAAGTVSHAYRVFGIPVGLVLAMVAGAAVIIAVRLLTADRWAALATGLGAMGVTIVLSGTGAGGSVIVPQSVLGVVWTLWLPLVTAFVVAWPERVDRGRAVEAAD
ncbi:MAG: histidinol dehydrogenase [Actinobacteria bacterium]|uniref:histidinol dehydrogenase n=1 Tax=unclassified Microbacterium TaxID=2609290 RepID=UPI000C49DA84|nr:MULTISPECIES: histidinol dehydrogenase [unclassified Microbacterium]MEC8762444.1 histidinol dehydrogenase [Actinomycetota bacterium]MBU18755.1 histidinol dehydrogenase [Microbacterium sp.]MEE2815596.1 histidinol dehydrogenase [Actinomycetota bacterium]RUA25657.1 MAG: histidinol dehydrogenase [Actinomycetota bacterium]HAM11820.1 histidinol dehydrogenase [Microbacterium sp.]